MANVKVWGMMLMLGFTSSAQPTELWEINSCHQQLFPTAWDAANDAVFEVRRAT